MKFEGHDIGAIAADMLKKRLPGFETRIDGARDAVVIQGALPIAMTVSAETVFYPIMMSTPIIDVEGARLARHLRDATEDDRAREARMRDERERIERELASSVDDIADRIRRFGIDALGLAEYIAERERNARREGHEDGYLNGREQGIAVGRRETLAAIARGARFGVEG
jgi:hypothetical protein